MSQMNWPVAPWGQAWSDASAMPRPRTPVTFGLERSMLGLTGADLRSDPYAAPSIGQGVANGAYAPAFSGEDPSSFKSRIGAAIQGLQGTLNPNAGGAVSFLSGLTGGYTGTQNALQAGYQQQAQTQANDRATAEAEYDRGLKNQYQQAQTGYLNAGIAQRQAAANDPGTDTDEIPVMVPGLPLGTLNRRTHVFTPASQAAAPSGAPGQPAPGKPIVRPFAPTRSGTTRDPALARYEKELDKAMGTKDAVTGFTVPLPVAQQRALAATRLSYPSFTAPSGDAAATGSGGTAYHPDNPFAPKP